MFKNQQISALLNTKQAAQYLGVSDGTLRRWRSERFGPAYVQQSPRNVRYRMEDLQKWVTERVRTPLRARRLEDHMALIRRKGSKVWYYPFTFGGKRYRASTKQKTKAAAQAVEAEVLNGLDKGLPVTTRSAKCPTLRECVPRFTEWYETSNRLEATTRRYYKYGVRLVLWSRLADMPVDQRDDGVVECTRFHRLVYDPKTRTTTTETVACAPAYINQAIRTLNAIMGKAVDWKKLSATRPRIKTLKVKGRDKLIDHDTEIKLQQELEASTTHGRHDRLRKQAWLFMVILQDTGMRPDEVYPMRIGNIHWADIRIWVPEGKTENSRRFVGISDRMKTMLAEWCKGRDGWVFPSKRSKSGHLESIAKGFQEARKRAGLSSEIVPYSARHTYGTYQMQATGNVFAVSRAMGHADVKSMEPYQHPDTVTLNRAINRRNQEREQHRVAAQPTQDWHTNWHTPEYLQ